MNLLKNLGKGLFWLLILILLIAPLGLICHISNREIAQYQVPETPHFVETAYGAAIQAQRRDVEEYVTVSGVFVSEASAFQELTVRNPGRIRWDIGIGDEVREGQSLGTYLGEAIVSQYSGIVLEINAYDAQNAYLKIRLLSPVLLECQVSQKVLTALSRAESLTTKDGESVTLQYASQVRNADGSSCIRLAIGSDLYAYGQKLEELHLYTGYSYLQALVLPESCLYQKAEGEDQPWYARQVTADGVFLQEVQITRGYSNGQLVCVTGIEAGQYFDAGYRAITDSGNP